MPSWLELAAEEDRALVAGHVQRRLSNEVPNAHYEFRGLRKDRTVIVVEVHGSRTELNGQPAVIGSLIDITERKRGEVALRESEERYRALVENAPTGIFVNVDNKFAYVNNAFCRLLGATSQEQLLGTPVFERFHPDFHDVIRQRIGRIREHGESVPLMEQRYLRLDGSAVEVEAVAIPIIFQGQPAAQVLVNDITERNRALQALRESERNLSDAQRIAHMGSWVLELTQLDDVNSNPLHWSDEVFRIFGYEPGQLQVSNDNFFRAVPAEDRPRIREAVATALREHQHYSIDHRICLPNGTERIVHEESDVICDAKTGRPIRMAGTIQDITERKRAVDRLRASEERFATIFRSSPVGTCITTMEEGTFLDANDAFLNIEGFTREEILGRTSLEMGYWRSPADRQKAVEVLKETGSVSHWEIDYRRKDGTTGHSLRSLARITLNGVDCILTILSVTSPIASRPSRH